MLVNVFSRLGDSNQSPVSSREGYLSVWDSQGVLLVHFQKKGANVNTGFILCSSVDTSRCSFKKSFRLTNYTQQCQTSYNLINSCENATVQYFNTSVQSPDLESNYFHSFIALEAHHRANRCWDNAE